MQDFAPLNAFLYAQGLAQRGEKARWHVLTGGVSSEIWRVELPGRSVCVKRALSKLKVSEDWQAPTSRNAYEWQWLCFVASHLPQAAPRPLARDAAAGVFAMEFLAPERYPVWKEQLLSGRVDPATAEQVGVALATLHEMSAHKVELAQQFDSSQNFRALRIEPYLLATAARHPDLADYIGSLAERTLSTVI